MACGCAQKSKQKFAVVDKTTGATLSVFDQYQQAQVESRKVNGKVRVVNGA